MISFQLLLHNVQSDVIPLLIYNIEVYIQNSVFTPICLLIKFF